MIKKCKSMLRKNVPIKQKSQNRMKYILLNK